MAPKRARLLRGIGMSCDTKKNYIIFRKERSNAPITFLLWLIQGSLALRRISVIPHIKRSLGFTTSIMLQWAFSCAVTRTCIETRTKYLFWDAKFISKSGFLCVRLWCTTKKLIVKLEKKLNNISFLKNSIFSSQLCEKKINKRLNKNK